MINTGLRQVQHAARSIADLSFSVPAARMYQTPDEFVLELAVESRADFLVTFNSKDFAGAERFGIRVIRPREFLAIIGEAP